MRERVIVPQEPLPGNHLSSAQRRCNPARPAQQRCQGSARLGEARLRITALEVNGAGDYATTGAVTSLLAQAPVAIEDGSALIFVGHVSQDGAEGQLTCQMHCRLHGSSQVRRLRSPGAVR